jgi:methionyl-tRNA synthetase
MQKSYSTHFGAPIRNSNFRAKLEEAVLCDDSNILCECRYESLPILSGPHRRIHTDGIDFRKAPHVGHFYTMVITDILKRWRVLLGDKDAQLLTGTDEHGMKVSSGA